MVSPKMVRKQLYIVNGGQQTCFKPFKIGFNVKFGHFGQNLAFFRNFDILATFRSNFDHIIGFRALYNPIVHIEVHINTRGAQGSKNRGGFFLSPAVFTYSPKAN